MIKPAHRRQMPDGWMLRVTPEEKMVTAIAPDGFKKDFDTAAAAVAWANDSTAVAAWRTHITMLNAQVIARRRAANPTRPADGWNVRYLRSTDTWEASKGGHCETFATEEEAIAFTWD